MSESNLIGIYGGTFDPIHWGHLNLAIQIMEIHKLSEIWFCPVQISPHKLDQVPTPIEHRLEMLRIGLENVPNCRITDVEAKREGPSFTIDTLRSLVAEEKRSSSPNQFCLVMGDDSIPGFFQWHQPKEIVKLVPIFIGRRSILPVDIERLTGDPEICEALRRGMTKTRLFEISATDIRNRIKEGEYCGHLVPEKVLDYIYTHRLY